MSSSSRPSPTNTYCIGSILMPRFTGSHRVCEAFGSVRVGHAKQYGDGFVRTKFPVHGRQRVKFALGSVPSGHG